MDTQLGIRMVSCPHLGTLPFGLTKEMWLSGVHSAANLGRSPGFPLQGLHGPAFADWGARLPGLCRRAVVFHLDS